MGDQYHYMWCIHDYSLGETQHISMADTLILDLRFSDNFFLEYTSSANNNLFSQAGSCGKLYYISISTIIMLSLLVPIPRSPRGQS